jgi:membrane-bound lytic murein transglycosylase D
MMFRSHALFIGCSALFVLLVGGASAADTPDSPALSSASATPLEPSDPAAELVLKQANDHFSAGRDFYFKGDAVNAKREFDAAIGALLSASANGSRSPKIEHRLDEMCDLIYRFDVEKLGAGAQEDASVVFDKAPIDEVSHMTFPVDESLAPKLKTELNQTASGIPLELSEPVLSYVHFFSTEKGKGILLSGFKRSGQYKELIQRIFTEENVPQELIYLAQAESGFLPRAVSRKSAVGMWQFIAATGARYDLVRTQAFDERLDPEKATRAAAKYLKFLYARYADWYLAMAAYNCGEGAVDRAVERTGYADYWELLKRHALPKETSNYVPIIVAMTIMAKNPQDYGLDNIQIDAPLEYDTMQLSASTSLDLLADVTLQPVSVIRDLNPAFLRSVIPAGLTVHLPRGSERSARAALESVPAANRNAWRLHHVESGDTLEAIARSYHLPTQRIVAVNHAVDSLEAGDMLLIPAAYHPEKTPVVRTSRARQSHRATALRSTRVAATRRPAKTVSRKKTVLRAGSLSE